MSAPLETNPLLRAVVLPAAAALAVGAATYKIVLHLAEKALRGSK